MQDYEQYARITRAPVILPPAGVSEPPPESPPAGPSIEPPPMFLSVQSKRKPAGNRLTAVQGIVCALLLAIFLLTRFFFPEAHAVLRDWYSSGMRQVITVQIGEAG